jgi:CheY-like chemotaxis protein
MRISAAGRHWKLWHRVTGGVAHSEELPVRVLLVEDDFLIRLTLVEALVDDGFTVVEAETSDEALAAVAAYDDLRALLTDVQIPGVCDGVELAARARALRPDLPILFMTGRPDSVPDTTQTANDAFIAKPYLPSDVTKAVRRITGKRPDAG